MKSYVTEGTGSQQTLSDSQDNKIPVYANEADLDDDLANLADGELALYPSEGASLSVPIDEVKSRDMHAVTSNAVADIFSADIDNTKFALSTTANVEVTARYTGILYVTIEQSNTSGSSIVENGTELISDDNYAVNSYYRNFTVLIRKGRKYKWTGTSGTVHSQKFIPFNLS